MMRINFNDSNLEYAGIDAGGGDMYNYNNVPFTGTLEEFYPNGNLIAEVECVNGLQTELYENGQLKCRYYLKYNHFYNSFKKCNE